MALKMTSAIVFIVSRLLQPHLYETGGTCKVLSASELSFSKENSFMVRDIDLSSIVFHHREQYRLEIGIHLSIPWFS